MILNHEFGASQYFKLKVFLQYKTVLKSGRFCTIYITMYHLWDCYKVLHFHTIRYFLILLCNVCFGTFKILAASAQFPLAISIAF